jgi:hypothetical protein
MYYVIRKKKGFSLDQYVVMVAESMSFMGLFINWGLSTTDELEDATRFSYAGDAYKSMSKLNINEGDWEVVNFRF